MPTTQSDGPIHTSALPAWLAHNRAEEALRREAEAFNAAATRAMYARARRVTEVFATSAYPEL